jgi:hypothetical protein
MARENGNADRVLKQVLGIIGIPDLQAGGCARGL